MDYLEQNSRLVESLSVAKEGRTHVEECPEVSQPNIPLMDKKSDNRKQPIGDVDVSDKEALADEVRFRRNMLDLVRMVGRRTYKCDDHQVYSQLANDWGRVCSRH